MGWAELAVSAVAYAIGIVAQTFGVRRDVGRVDGFDVGLLARLASDRVYVLGFAAQVIGFLAAFLARESLPLYVVQTASAAALGIAAVIGALLLGWRVGPAEITALAVMAAGLAGVVLSAQQSVATPLPVVGGVVLACALAASALLSFLAARLTGTHRALALGALSGIDFAILAVATRSIGSIPLLELWHQPLAWLTVAAAVVGQSHLSSALQSGSATAAMAAMEATSAVVAAVAGIAVLGDRIVPGRGSLLVIGLLLVIGAVVVLALRPPQMPDESSDPADRKVVSQ